MLLSTVHAQNLQRVKFVVRANQATRAELDAFDLLRVGEVLEEEQFASVRRVLVHVLEGYSLREEVVPFIKARLAGLEARKVLSVVHRMSGQIRR